MLVAITIWDDAPWVARFRAALPGVKVVTPSDDYDPASIRYAAVWHAPQGLLAGLPNLEAIFSLGAGVDHIFAQPDIPDVPIVRVVCDDLNQRMCGWVLLQVLLHQRQQRAYDAFQALRLWKPLEEPSPSRIRVGVMGLGVLGADVSQKLLSLGFDVAGWSRSAKTIDGVACFSGDSGLDAFLVRTDILVVLLPATPDTRGILNTGLFSRLARDGALPERFPVLINAGRGALQVEADILAALDDGTLKGASLDVFETEPLPAESPLWQHPRVTITPHVAADSDPQAIVAGIAQEIARHGRGEALRHTVDRGKGY